MMRSPFEDECVLRRRACCPNWRQVSKKGELIRDPRALVRRGRSVLSTVHYLKRPD